MKALYKKAGNVYTEEGIKFNEELMRAMVPIIKRRLKTHSRLEVELMVLQSGTSAMTSIDFNIPYAHERATK